MLTFDFHEDPGHGWLEVSKGLVKLLGITPSFFSYEDEEYLYLEEDCDAGLFIDAMRRHKIPFGINSLHFENTPIRTMNHFAGWTEEETT